VQDLLPLILSNEFTEESPNLRVFAFLFEGARIGVGHRGLDPLRKRVLLKTEAWMAQVPDFRETPELQSVKSLFPPKYSLEFIQSSPFVTALNIMARRAPFPVINDAVDAARLFGLYYRRPTFLLDSRGLKAPLLFMPCPESFVLPTSDGPLHRPGAPVLADSVKALRSLSHDLIRSPVHEATRTFLLILIDSGHPNPLDSEEVVGRAENWFHSLTHSKLKAHCCVPTP
jgi:hypothetical protein